MHFLRAIWWFCLVSALTSSSADDVFGRFNKELFRNVTVILSFKKKWSQKIPRQQKQDDPHSSSIILKEGRLLGGLCEEQRRGEMLWSLKKKKVQI